VRQSEGAFVTATDEQMMQAVRDTGRLAGIFAEPAAAAAVAAIGVARQQRLLNDHSDVLAMITGNGLKDIAGALKAVGKPHDIEPSLDAILKVANA
jgi:threonine synthase